MCTMRPPDVRNPVFTESNLFTMLTNNQSPKYVGNKTQNRWQSNRHPPVPPHYAPVQQERLSHTGWLYFNKSKLVWTSLNLFGQVQTCLDKSKLVSKN